MGPVATGGLKTGGPSGCRTEGWGGGGGLSFEVMDCSGQLLSWPGLGRRLACWAT